MATKKAPLPPPVEDTVEDTPIVVTTIDFTDDVKDLLRALTSALNNRPAPIINLTGAPVVAPDMRPTSTATSNLPVPEPKQTIEPTISLTQIRTLISAKMAEGKTNSVAALLTRHGAKNASTLEEDQYSSFYTNLLTL